MKNFFVNVLANIVGFILLTVGIVAYDKLDKIHKKKKKNKKES